MTPIVTLAPMTTAANLAVVVGANGIVRCCAWCLSAQTLAVLHRAHRCTDGLCEPCAAKLEEEVA